MLSTTPPRESTFAVKWTICCASGDSPPEDQTNVSGRRPPGSPPDPEPLRKLSLRKSLPLAPAARCTLRETFRCPQRSRHQESEVRSQKSAASPQPTSDL